MKLIWYLSCHFGHWQTQSLFTVIIRKRVARIFFEKFAFMLWVNRFFGKLLLQVVLTSQSPLLWRPILSSPSPPSFFSFCQSERGRPAGAELSPMLSSFSPSRSSPLLPALQAAHSLENNHKNIHYCINITITILARMTTNTNVLFIKSLRYSFVVCCFKVVMKGKLW